MSYLQQSEQMPTIKTHERERELLAMLRTKRPSGSATEQAFCEQWLHTLPDAIVLGSERNVVVEVPHENGELANVMYSSHFDTVHTSHGRQKIHHDKQTGMVMLAKKERQANCLGADCTAGVWLMREMILAGKPGLYVFHGAEEVGGRGSHELADRYRDKFHGIDACIAFDRYGYNSVITHQLGRCCSQAFALSLASQLGPIWECDDGGLFTDSANYVDLIAECTNLSVGYMHHHTQKEQLHTWHLYTLLDRMLALDTDSLIYEREPGQMDDDYELSWEADWKQWRADYYRDTSDSSQSILEIVKARPELIVSLLEEYKIDAQMLLDYAGDSV